MSDERGREKGERHNGSREKLTNFVLVGYSLASAVFPGMSVQLIISTTWLAHRDGNVPYKFKVASQQQCNVIRHAYTKVNVLVYS